MFPHTFSLSVDPFYSLFVQGSDPKKVCNAANNSNCGLMEFYDRRKNCIQIFVKDESLSPGKETDRVDRHGLS